MSKCSYETLTIYGTSNVENHVTPDFDIGDEITNTGLETIDNVDCSNCGESFSDLTDAREHIDNAGN